MIDFMREHREDTLALALLFGLIIGGGLALI